MRRPNPPETLKKFKLTLFSIVLAIFINLSYFYLPFGDHIWLAALVSGPMVAMAFSVEFIMSTSP
jgi:hypothetical protein